MRRGFLLLVAFTMLSIILTYPLILNMDTAVKDMGDPLLNSWILAWNSHKLLTDPSSLFHANIFHPFANTLAYSEHLFASALIALPVIALTGKAILGHNVVLLLSFILSGLGMYALVFHMTRSRLAGMASWIIFAFCPYRFDHLGHLQLQSCQWIPLAFLYLHKFQESERTRDILLFTLFFLLQALSCGYYAVFLSISSGLLILWGLWKKARRHPVGIRSHVLKLFLFAAITSCILYPFYRPYRAVRKEMGFEHMSVKPIPGAGNRVFTAMPVSQEE